MFVEENFIGNFKRNTFGIDGIIFFNSEERSLYVIEEYKKTTSKNKEERSKFEFVQVVFDSGGQMSQWIRGRILLKRERMI
jgi:hypothetical protein